MINNLITDPWIPVRRQSGLRERIAPWQIVEAGDPVIALDAPRADFNAALVQFLIGLVQTTASSKAEDDWIEWLEQPPSTEELRTRMTRHESAFQLVSDSGAFMQDWEDFEVKHSNVIGKLLIDAPKGNTLKRNKDHFSKRDRVNRVCRSCATMALYCLQINAPSGGQGHRTSLRGGGPLTTLVYPDDQSDLPNDLWRKVWLNVRFGALASTDTAAACDQQLVTIYPWMAQTRTSEAKTGVQTTPLDAHPFQAYWGMPRRIRINWTSDQPGHCDLCGSDCDCLISEYRTKNYGVDYAGAWQHPLTPYRETEKDGLLPTLVQPGGFSYQHWNRLVLGQIVSKTTYFPAEVITSYQTALSRWNLEGGAAEFTQLRIHVFGYDMDNMKARCWYEATLPLYTVPEAIRSDFSARVSQMIDAATLTADQVKTCIRQAWFKRPGDIGGDTSFLQQAFYAQSTQTFYRSLESLQSHLTEKGEDVNTTLGRWNQYLKKQAVAQFDHWAVQGDITASNPKRIADARNLLKSALEKKLKHIEIRHDPSEEVA